MEWREARAIFGGRGTSMTFWKPVRRFVLSLSLVTAPLVLQASEPLVIRHSFFDTRDSKQLSYKGEVLSLLLEKSKAKYGPYVLERREMPGWSQSRSYAELERGNLDLIASQTNETREKTSIPIRYCLYKGLLGVRVGMGTADMVRELNHITTWEQLKEISLGQVFDWPDYAIQSEAGLRVLRLPELNSSITRMKMGTFQLMPLGVVEVGPVAKRNNLSTISNWAIAYPTAYYFFVSKARPELAERLNYGFEVAIKDQSFEQLFAKRIGPLVAGAELEKRKVFYIKNPYLPQSTPLDRKELWHPIAQVHLL
jgi:hypothetical protein